MLSPNALSQALLSILCYDNNKAALLAARLDINLFVGRSNRRIAEVAIEYIKQFRQPPGEQLEFLLESDLRRGEEGRFLGQTLDILKTQYPQLQSEFILSELDQWEAAQKITIAAQEAIERLSEGDLEGAKSAFYLPKHQLANGSQGIWLKDSRAMFRAYDQQESEYFSSGIEASDLIGVRPERKTISTLMAATGKGKSWYLVNQARASIQHHHSTLVITMEISEEKWALRFLQCLFSLTRQDIKQLRIPYFDTSGMNGTSIQFRDLERDSVFNRRPELRSRLEMMKGSYPQMLIKEYPPGVLTMDMLNLYLDSLLQEFGFDPDVILIDQPSNMRLDQNNLRISTGRLWVDLRGIAVARNKYIGAVSQGNRESDSAKLVDRGNVAEDWSIPGTCDIVYTYSQTPQEANLGLSRILVAKARDVRDRTMLLNAQSYDIGQFSIDSVVMRQNVFQELEGLVET